MTDTFVSAVSLAARLQKRSIGAREVLDAHLRQIHAQNGRINAICTLDEEGAQSQALALDQKQGELGPLHGLPIAIKDLVAVRGMRCTQGSPLFQDHISAEDDLFVSRLREAGAVIIGKTNVPEFGAGSQTFNRVFGVTKNPYRLDLTPGGSSGGAAAALASGMLPLADGSDLGGSLRNPASFCNLVGFRPSPGRVPRYPVTHLLDSLAVLGPMARSVEDAALLLSVMAGPDPRAPLSLNEPGTEFLHLQEHSCQDIKIALSPDLGYLPLDAEVRKQILEAARVFEDLGCRVEEAAPDLTGAEKTFLHLRSMSFAAAFGDLLERQESLKDSIQWNTRVGLQLTPGERAEAEQSRAQIYYRAVDFFSRYDFLLCAAAQVPPFSVELEWVRQIGDVKFDNYLQWMQVCCAISLTGMPAISVPGGFTSEGLPVGVQLVGGFRQDKHLLELAKAFETATGHGQTRPQLSAPHS